MTTEEVDEEIKEVDEEIHVANDDSPILTRYEPNFQRVFARGTLLQMEEDDDNMVEIAFWSSKDTDIELEDQDVDDAVGYALETEIMMDWDSILRLRELLDNYIEDNAPDRYLSDE
jgi:hypothetical protein